MSEVCLEWVPPGLHTADDLEWILLADEAQPTIDRIALVTVDKALRQGNMHLFRLNPGPGVIVTEIREEHGVRRLCLVRGAGRAAHQLRAIFKLLEASRVEWGCECIETVVYSHRLKRALELSGAQTEGFILRYPAEEARDGQQD